MSRRSEDGLLDVSDVVVFFHEQLVAVSSTLNRLLLRDELRRLFSLLDLTMPCRAREGFEELLMQVAGKEDEIPVVVGMWSNA